jgi:hypothetical protein
VWDEIARRVNAISDVVRKPDTFRKKWDDLKLKAKRKTNRLRGNRNETGNLPLSGDEDQGSEALTEMEERIAGLLGDDLVYGIEGGIDTDKRSSDPPPSKKVCSSRFSQHLIVCICILHLAYRYR